MILFIDRQCHFRFWSTLGRILPLLALGLLGFTPSLATKVPFYSQWDDAWSAHPLGFALSNQTIGKQGCGVSSAAMVLSYYSGREVKPDELNDALKAYKAFSDADLIWYDTDPKVGSANWRSATRDLIKATVDIRPWNPQWIKEGVHDILKENVQVGRPVIVYLNSRHYAVVTRYDQSKDQFYINDPWKSKPYIDPNNSKDTDYGFDIPFEKNAIGAGLNDITQIVILYPDVALPPNVDTQFGMRDKYISLGGEKGILGPATNTAQDFDVAGRKGRKQEFAYGTLYAFAPADAFWMPSNFAQYFEQSKNQLGLPIRDPYSSGVTIGEPQPPPITQGPMARARVDFENGSLFSYPGLNDLVVATKDTGFAAEYFDNPDLSGSPILKRYEPEIQFDWGNNLPAPGITQDRFSARWTGTVNLDGPLPTFRFFVDAQGRARLKIDNDWVIQAWTPSNTTRHEAFKFISRGKHSLVLEYAHDEGPASVKFLWTGGPDPVFAAERTLGAPDIQPEEAPLPVPPPKPPAASISTATVLALDTSSSMQWPDPDGKAKIDGLKNAASVLVNMIRTESQMQGMQHRVSVVTFSDSATTVLGLSNDWDKANSVIAGLTAYGNTNIAQAIANANAQLKSAPPDQPRLILLLTDGVPTQQLNGQPSNDFESLKQEILQGPVVDAAKSKNCIYTVGFGGPDQPGSQTPSYDPDFLRAISQASGCGQSYEAKNANELANVYIKFRHQSLGSLLGEFNGTIRQGETVQAGSFDTPANQATLYATLNWPGSTLELDLTDPKGQTVDANYPGASLSTAPQMIYLIVQNPIAGKWSVSVRGVDVPEGVTNFNAIVSARVGANPTAPPNPPPSSLPLPSTNRNNQVTTAAIGIIAAIVLVGFVCALVIGLSSQKSREGGAYLFVQNGFAPRAQVAARNNLIQIGRDPANAMAFPTDLQVSRRHAEIRREAAGYVLYDLNSQNGTFVNDQRISRHILREGDHIRVGQSIVVFASPRHS